jgi:hypothetical protein
MNNKNKIQNHPVLISLNRRKSRNIFFLLALRSGVPEVPADSATKLLELWPYKVNANFSAEKKKASVASGFKNQ